MYFHQSLHLSKLRIARNQRRHHAFGLVSFRPYLFDLSAFIPFITVPNGFSALCTSGCGFLRVLCVFAVQMVGIFVMRNIMNEFD
jgi:hypothetical protein